MKNLIILGMLVLSSPAISQNIIYCPPTVTCDAPRDFNSCSYNSDMFDKENFQGKIEKGTYFLNHVWAGYEIDANNDEFNNLTRCQYANTINDHLTKYIVLISKRLLNADLTTKNSWVIYGDRAQCIINLQDGQSCPMLQYGN